ncbi:MAG: hypothetical protein CL424_16025 [Acidimicrobiaceae bacterium]|nr:hypothetical protein [Acidimicrobiaceae bacterium]
MGAERTRHDERAGTTASGGERPLASKATAKARSGGAAGSGPASLALADFLGGPSDVPSVQAKLEVGAVDDPYERDADRMADEVMRRIDPGGATAPMPAGRVARSTGDPEIGAEGGAVSGHLQRAIESSSGSSMPDGLRSTMEQGFDRDLSNVRVHTDSDAAGRIAARAFTHGDDIHFAPGQFQPDTAGGRRLIAHELAHVVQQHDGRMAAGTVSRLMWDSKRFLTETNERFTTRSTAQKTLAPMLDEYHTKWPFGDLDEAKATSALEHVMKMQMIAEAYVAKNVKNVGGEDIVRSSRSKRIAGMQAFVAACQGEAAWLTQRADRGKADSDKLDTAALQQTASGDGTVTKIKDHYAGDAASCFRKLGKLIDFAVPAPGDASSISLEVEIPVEPGLAITLGLGTKASRGTLGKTEPGQTPKPTPVDIGLNVEAGVAGDVKIAKIGAALGGYMAASAKSGADAAELLSYALFRKARQSPIVPREVTNFMWGEGNSDAFGWQVAESWSLDVENRLLASNMVGGEEKNDNYVETGGYGKLSGEVGFDKAAKLKGEVMGYTGTRVDAASLKARKGGAGKANLRSGANPLWTGTGDRMTKQGTRGTTQKDVGRRTNGFKITTEAGNDFIGGGLEFGMRWISDGKHGKKTYALSSAELAGSLKFTMPGDKLVAGGVGNYVPALIKTINTILARGRDTAAKQEGASARDLGMVTTGISSFASSVAELGQSPENWTAPAKMAEATDGFSSSTTYQLTVSGDFVKGELKIALTQEKANELAKVAKEITETAGGAAGAKLKITSTSTLLEVTWDGTTWGYSWAGGAG